MFAPMGWKCLFSVVRYCTSAPHMVSAGGAGSSLPSSGRKVPRCQQTAGRALHIALKAGDLACKEHVGVLFQAEPCAQHPGCIQEGVAVHDAVPHELGMFRGRVSC